MAAVKKVRPDDVPKAKKKAPATGGSFALATVKSEPSESLQDYSILIFGEKKIGKTSLASMFPDAYFLSLEPGTKAVSVYKSDISNWREFKDAVRLLRKDTQFKNTVVDTVDIAYRYCEDYVCQQLGITHVSEADWGKGWSGVRQEFEGELRKLMSAPGKGTILISHSVEKEIKTRSGEKYDRIQPTMANIARDTVEAMVDIWGYYAYNGTRRTLTIVGDDHIAAGHRLQTRFRSHGDEIVSIDMGTSKEEAYENLLAAFNNAYEIQGAPAVSRADDEPPMKIVKKKRA